MMDDLGGTEVADGFGFGGDGEYSSGVASGDGDGGCGGDGGSSGDVGTSRGGGYLRWI